MPHLKILNQILVDPIRPSLGRKYVHFFKHPFGALSKIGDQIRKYVVKDNGFPFLQIGSAVWVLDHCEVAKKIFME